MLTEKYVDRIEFFKQIFCMNDKITKGMQDLVYSFKSYLAYTTLTNALCVLAMFRRPFYTYEVTQ